MPSKLSKQDLALLDSVWDSAKGDTKNLKSRVCAVLLDKGYNGLSISDRSGRNRPCISALLQKAFFARIIANSPVSAIEIIRRYGKGNSTPEIVESYMAIEADCYAGTRAHLRDVE